MVLLSINMRSSNYRMIILEKKNNKFYPDIGNLGSEFFWLVEQMMLILKYGMEPKFAQNISVFTHYYAHMMEN